MMSRTSMLSSRNIRPPPTLFLLALVEMEEGHTISVSFTAAYPTEPLEDIHARHTIGVLYLLPRAEESQSSLSTATNINVFILLLVVFVLFIIVFDYTSSFIYKAKCVNVLNNGKFFIIGF